MYYEMTIAGCKRKLPVCPVTDDLYIAGFVMFGDAEITVKSAEELLKRVPDFDVILTAEAKGIPLAHEISRQSGYKPYVVARKKKKAYMTGIIQTDVDSITTEGIQTLIISDTDAEILKSGKILIVDDVISTGGSLASLEALVSQIGGDIAGKATVLAEGDAANRDDIIFLEKLPLFDKDGNLK